MRPSAGPASISHLSFFPRTVVLRQSAILEPQHHFNESQCAIFGHFWAVNVNFHYTIGAAAWSICPMIGTQPKLSEFGFLFPPFGTHLDPDFKINLTADKIFDILAGFRADLFQHLSLATNENSFLGIPFHIDKIGRAHV